MEQTDFEMMKKMMEQVNSQKIDPNDGMPLISVGDVKNEHLDSLKQEVLQKMMQQGMTEEQANLMVGKTLQDSADFMNRMVRFQLPDETLFDEADADE